MRNSCIPSHYTRSFRFFHLKKPPSSQYSINSLIKSRVSSVHGRKRCLAEVTCYNRNWTGWTSIETFSLWVTFALVIGWIKLILSLEHTDVVVLGRKFQICIQLVSSCVRLPTHRITRVHTPRREHSSSCKPCFLVRSLWMILEFVQSPSTVNSFPTFVSTLQFSPQDPIPSVALSPTPSMGKRRETDEERPRGRSRGNPLKRKLSPGIGAHTPDTDADRYISARRKLKRAVLEHYRCVLAGKFELSWCRIDAEG